MRTVTQRRMTILTGERTTAPNVAAGNGGRRTVNTPVASGGSSCRS